MSTTITPEKRAHLIAQARLIVTAAEAEHRAVTPTEESRFDALMAEADSGKLPDPVWKPGQGAERRELREGEVRTLRVDEKLSDAHPNTEGLRLGLFVRGITSGNWRGAEAEKRAANSELTGTAGQFLVPLPISTQVIDLARAKTCVFQAGAATVPMESQTLSRPRITGDIPTSFKAELAAAATGNNTLDRVLFTAKTLYALAPFSAELAEDTDITDVMTNALAKAIAVAVDAAALRGDGTGANPLGLRNQAGVPTQSMGVNGAAPTNFDFVSTAVDTVRTANWEANALITSPRTIGEVDRLKDSQLRYLAPPDSYANLKKFPTTIVPTNLTQGTGTTCTDAYVGQFNQLAVGIRSELQIRVMDQGFDGTYSAAQHNVKFLVAYMRLDVQVFHPAAFVAITGIL